MFRLGDTVPDMTEKLTVYMIVKFMANLIDDWVNLTELLLLLEPIELVHLII